MYEKCQEEKLDILKQISINITFNSVNFAFYFRVAKLASFGCFSHILSPEPAAQ
jgi:hypothetical protein